MIFRIRGLSIFLLNVNAIFALELILDIMTLVQSQEFHFNNVKKLHLNITKCTIDPKMPEGNQLTRYLECRGLVRDDDKSIELFK